MEKGDENREIVLHSDGTLRSEPAARYRGPSSSTEAEGAIKSYDVSEMDGVVKRGKRKTGGKKKRRDG